MYEFIVVQVIFSDPKFEANFILPFQIEREREREKERERERERESNHNTFPKKLIVV